MLRRGRACLAGALCVALALPMAARAGELTVFAAASLATALAEIEAGFEAETGHALSVALAGSSALARQIAQGAPADLFISANPGWMDSLDQAGLLEPGTRADLLSNTLVLIGPAGARPLALEGPDLAARLGARLGADRLAMALVEAVPAGIYGKAALESLGLWAQVEARVAQADNVRAALALVAVGAAPLGIVYGSDARADPRVAVLATFPPESHPPIIYPVALLAGRNTLAAAAFLAYLRTEPAHAAFRRQGFGVIGE